MTARAAAAYLMFFLFMVVSGFAPSFIQAHGSARFVLLL